MQHLYSMLQATGQLAKKPQTTDAIAPCLAPALHDAVVKKHSNRFANIWITVSSKLEYKFPNQVQSIALEQEAVPQYPDEIN